MAMKRNISYPWVVLSFIFVVGLIANVFVIQSLFVPRWTDWKQSKERLQEAQNELAHWQSQPFTAKVDPSQILQIVKQAPPSDAIARFVLELDKLAAKTGIRVSTLTFAAETATDDGGSPAVSNDVGSQTNGAAQAGRPALQAQSVTLNMEGTFEQIHHTIAELQSMERIVKIGSWQIQTRGTSNTGDQASKAIVYSLDLNAIVYSAAGVSDAFDVLPPIASMSK